MLVTGCAAYLIRALPALSARGRQVLPLGRKTVIFLIVLLVVFILLTEISPKAM